MIGHCNWVQSVLFPLKVPCKRIQSVEVNCKHVPLFKQQPPVIGGGIPHWVVIQEVKSPW